MPKRFEMENYWRTISCGREEIRIFLRPAESFVEAGNSFQMSERPPGDPPPGPLSIKVFVAWLQRASHVLIWKSVDRLRSFQALASSNLARSFFSAP
jgi:hypothetical protein